MAKHRKVPGVAFLIPMYNAEATIEACLHSIISQSFHYFEAVVVDDGSSDRSADLVTTLARSDSRIRLIRMTRNSGVATALNIGLKETNAEFIARLDSDDEALPTRLEEQVEMLLANPTVAVCGSYVIYMAASSEKEKIGKVPVENCKIQEMLTATHDCPFFHPSVMFRRTLVTEIGGYRTFFRNSEDYDLWLRLSKIHDFANIPRPLTRFRFSAGGASISDLLGQRLYARLAKASYTRPHVPLDKLWNKILHSQSEQEQLGILMNDYLYNFRKLFELGWIRDTVLLFSHAKRDLGVSAAMSLAWQAYLIERKKSS